MCVCCPVGRVPLRRRAICTRSSPTHLSRLTTAHVLSLQARRMGPGISSTHPSIPICPALPPPPCALARAVRRARVNAGTQGRPVREAASRDRARRLLRHHESTPSMKPSAQDNGRVCMRAGKQGLPIRRRGPHGRKSRRAEPVARFCAGATSRGGPTATTICGGMADRGSASGEDGRGGLLEG